MADRKKNLQIHNNNLLFFDEVHYILHDILRNINKINIWFLAKN